MNSPCRTLLALSLITLPVLAVSSSLPPTSLNDPFRAIAVVHRAQQPDPPLCCLKPLPTSGVPEGPEDVLLSFEEWKSKQLHAASPTDPVRQKVETSADSGTPIDTNTKVQNLDIQPTDVPSPDTTYPPSDDALPPHFRVPITDRFNYANLDCSARVHMSHKSTKSVSSILSSKKDKYMLSPCSADGQFVVVELCDDIRIDTVQLANFEFFSGVFKDFSVSVAKTYTGTNEGWTPAGTYRAKNVRGVQSFHPPTSLRDFYRFIRIDFHSHYGHEYYCPVSLLRVYGLTHLEEWKWDMWQSESRARLKESAARHALIGEPVAGATNPKVASSDGANVSTPLDVAETRSYAKSASSPEEVVSTTRDLSSSPSTPPQSRRSLPVHVLDDATLTVSSGDGEQKALATQSAAVHSVTEAISSLLSMSSPGSAGGSLIDHSHFHDSDTHAVTTLSSQSNSHPTPPVQAPQSSAQWGGESIYRTIMNRLTILEANHTLYARYVEEQTAGVREVLRKINEEVGRLESVSRMQAQMYQRTVHEWERQRLRLEFEHGELLSRVNFLSEEVILEKRLGIAQLCLLLAVLVFIGLTRGAPSTQHPPSIHSSRREWGVRNLSFGSSTEGWNLLRRRSLSPTEQSGSTKAEKATAMDDCVLPRSTGSLDLKHEPHTTNHVESRTIKQSSTSHKRMHVVPTFRTPTKPRPMVLIEPYTLPRAETLTRSQSSSTSGHPQGRSMKRWARTAHLHEVKVLRERRGSGSSVYVSATGTGPGKRVGNRDVENERGLGDVFCSPSASPVRGKTRRRRRPLVPFHSYSEESTDGDAWIDTDVDGGEDEGGGEDEDEESVGSEKVVVLNSPTRDVFG